MRLALILLIGLAALTDAFTTLTTPLEAHSTTTEKTPNSGKWMVGVGQPNSGNNN